MQYQSAYKLKKGQKIKLRGGAAYWEVLHRGRIYTTIKYNQHIKYLPYYESVLIPIN